MVAQPRAGGKPAGSPGTEPQRRRPVACSPAGPTPTRDPDESPPTGADPSRFPGRKVRGCGRAPAGSRDTGEVLIAGVTVLAHQGGWDEMLMVLTPIAVFALLLKLANSRARAAQAAQEAEATAARPDEAATGEPRPE